MCASSAMSRPNRGDVSGQYLVRLKSYQRWSQHGLRGLSPGSIAGPEYIADANGVTAEKAMFAYETHGKSVPCSDIKTLADYAHGKFVRDFLFSTLKKDVNAGLFEPEEFLRDYPLTASEFSELFGREVDYDLLWRIWHAQWTVGYRLRDRLKDWAVEMWCWWVANRMLLRKLDASGWRLRHPLRHRELRKRKPQ